MAKETPEEGINGNIDLCSSREQTEAIQSADSHTGEYYKAASPVDLLLL
jgi:hypothetical protein